MKEGVAGCCQMNERAIGGFPSFVFFFFFLFPSLAGEALAFAHSGTSVCGGGEIVASTGGESEQRLVSQRSLALS